MSFSVRNWLRRRDAKEATRSDERRRARELVDRGIAAESSHTPAEALQHYRNAVEADDSFAPAHVSLGLALQAQGDLAAAIASYERAIAVEPENAAAHYNLALVELLRLRYPEAETRFRAALRIRDNFPEAWVGLAGALEALERDEEALSALDKAVALRDDYMGALLNSSTLLRKMGRLETAAARMRRVVELEPENYVAHCRLGICLYDLGHLSDAEAAYRRALVFKPDYHEAKANLAFVLKAKGSMLEALPLLFDVVANDPTNPQLRRSLAEALQDVAFDAAGEKERRVLLSLCTDDRIAGQFLSAPVASLIKGSAGFQVLRDSAKRREDPFTSVDRAVTSFLHDPLLLAALPRMQLPDAGVEEVLAHVRRCILLRCEAPSGLAAVDPVVPAEFICALARQCFFNGYAYFANEDERPRVASVREALESALSEAMPNLRDLESTLAVASLYDSLHTLQGCERLLAYPMADWSESFRPIVTEQIENRKREREIASQIAPITAIDDQISLAVRAQYEENPYPRWVTVPTPEIKTIEKLARRLRPGQAVRDRPRPVAILVAGCGTGHHSIQVGWAYPDSEILAVDLSLASLGYAARMTERFGISNIDYRQADILKLGELHRRFALVECAGVLHHLDDTMAGWRVLVSLLESDGLMKIALYSEKARGVVRAAREFSQSLNFPRTSEGTRLCRHAIMSLPDGHPAKGIMSSRDFFTLDGCRDMIMHVQEHQFTLPRIADCLEQLGLRLLQLECTTATRNRFCEMFPDSNADTDLAAWDRFEEIYPATFAAMYSFWCCRK